MADAKRNEALSKANVQLAMSKWTGMDCSALDQLKRLSIDLELSVAAGDLLYLGRHWYVTHTGLIRLAARKRCFGISVKPIPEFSDPLSRRYAFRAIVYKSRRSPGFSGHGDADPSNVSILVQGAEMRVAETRAVNRALRKAYGIGICSVEEIGSLDRQSSEPAPNRRNSRGLPMATDTPVPPSATGFVRSFGSMSSILIW